MKHIGENIASLRRANGMTQENLADAIGVTAQSVSKWETGTTMPDIMLLPVIADIFSVTVDALYGRVNAEKTRCAEDIYTETVEMLLDGIGRYMMADCTDKQLADYRAALRDDPHLQTGIMRCGDGSVFFCEQTGAVLLRHQQDALFSAKESGEVLALLGEDGFRRLIAHFFEKHGKTVTVASVVKLLACEQETARRYLEALTAWGMLETNVCDLGEEQVTVYDVDWFASNKLLMLRVIDAYARELAVKRNHLYCWAG